MAAPGWKSALFKSLEKNGKVPYSKFFQLATVRPDGRPANRTVVYRSILDNTDKLTFNTHLRSNKVDDIRAQEWAEVCWYFTETREQFRLSGKLAIVDADTSDSSAQEARERDWRGMSEKGLAWYTNPAPGKPRSENQADFEKPSPDPQDPVLPTFGLVTLDVLEVDYVDLIKDERMLYKSSEGASRREWSSQPLNP